MKAASNEAYGYTQDESGCPPDIVGDTHGSTFDQP